MPLLLPPRSSNPLDLFNVMGALFLCIMFLGTYNTSNVLPVLATERPVFYRERAANMYAVLPYGLALVSWLPAPSRSDRRLSHVVLRPCGLAVRPTVTCMAVLCATCKCDLLLVGFAIETRGVHKPPLHSLH